MTAHAGEHSHPPLLLSTHEQRLVVLQHFNLGWLPAGGWGRADVQAVHAQLHARQRRLLWASVQRVLEAEAVDADAGGSGHEVAAQLVSRASVQGSLGALLLGLYLQCLDGGIASPVL